MRTRRGRAALVITVPLLLGVAACAPADDATSGASDAGASASASASATAQGSVDPCSHGSLPLKTPGRVTIATDSPAYEPWFEDNDPTNGKGFESAVAYAVAARLGFSHDEVTWVREPFNNSYAPGAKDFDFDINQISITKARAKVVSFSDGYYSAAQAVIALKGSKAAGVSSLSGLKDLKLAAQTGTTSLTAITDELKPDQQPLIFDDTNAAKQALLNGQTDAIVADLPTAFYIVSAQIPKATIVGQFEPATGRPEQFGMLFEKGSTLVPCVDKALGALRSSGKLAAIQKRWLSDTVDVPVLK